MRFFSTCHHTQLEADILVERNRLVMNCYSLLGHEYSFFNVILSCLIALKILKGKFFLDLLVLESTPGVCLRPQAAKLIALQVLFSLIKVNLLSKNGHRLKWLDKSLSIHYEKQIDEKRRAYLFRENNKCAYIFHKFY